MNFSTLIGIVGAFTVFAVSLIHTGMDLGFFLNFHGVVIVLCGTLTATAICFPLNRVFALLKVFFLRVLGKNKADYSGVIEQILDLNKKATIGLSALSESLPSIKHPFLKEAVSLVAGGVLTENEIRFALDQRIRTLETEYEYDANIFKTMGRFSPAFGLLATTLGMIAVLQILGTPDSQSQIGPAMSIGLVGTLYGISLANFLFIPIGENLSHRAEEEIAVRKMIVEGAILLKSQSNPLTVREQMNSFVLPKNRVIRKSAA
jgi:chemotaxis protein MotA